jgi:hypothetical protein
MRTPTLPLIAVALLAACGTSSSKSASPQPPASSTGALAIITIGNSYRVYLPAPPDQSGHGKVMEVDPTAAASGSGVQKVIDLGVAGNLGPIGADGHDVVLVGLDDPLVWFIDTRTDTVTQVTLPTEAELFTTSDQQFFGSGVAVDAARRRAWVSVSFGILEYDLDTHQVTNQPPNYGHYTLPPVENFTYDPVSRRIFAPFYLCDPGTSTPGICVPYATTDTSRPTPTDGITMIELAADKIYTYVDAGAADPHAPLGLGPDATGLDPGLGLLVLTVENPDKTTSSVEVLDFAAATFDATASTWTATAVTLDMPDFRFTALAVDVVTHLAVVAKEYFGDVTFVDLAKVKQGVPKQQNFLMPVQPDTADWFTQGDPHGVTIGVLNGKTYALLLNGDRTWVAEIDLKGVKNLMDGVAGAPPFESLVKYVKASP